mmetsp:Transcript_15566/g.37384  ORF Transcript_15566/g.37384 Transcript_15566/m.37384 type:complete len:328 (-) Transcript_15566:206-1189(-)
MVTSVLSGVASGTAALASSVRGTHSRPDPAPKQTGCAALNTDPGRMPLNTDSNCWIAPFPYPLPPACCPCGARGSAAAAGVASAAGAGPVLASGAVPAGAAGSQHAPCIARKTPGIRGATAGATISAISFRTSWGCCAKSSNTSARALPQPSMFVTPSAESRAAWPSSSWGKGSMASASAANMARTSVGCCTAALSTRPAALRAPSATWPAKVTHMELAIEVSMPPPSALLAAPAAAPVPAAALAALPVWQAALRSCANNPCSSGGIALSPSIGGAEGSGCARSCSGAALPCTCAATLTRSTPLCISETMSLKVCSVTKQESPSPSS